jgi:uncharacterized protein YdaU (DUF1376 family)
VNYFSFHIGDYAARTRYLSPMADLAYRRLLDLYYTLEGPIPAAGVAAEIGLEDCEADVLLVLRKFFVECEGVWINTRCDEEIAKYQGKAERNREVGKLGGRPKKPTANPDGSEKEPIGNHPKNQEPLTNKEKRPRKARATPLPEGFKMSERVLTWAVEKGFFIRDLERQLEAFVSYVKRKGATYVDWDEALMTAIREDWAKARLPKPGDAARLTTPPTETAEENRRRLDAMNTPLSSEQKARADLARKAAMAAIHNITPKAAA